MPDKSIGFVLDFFCIILIIAIVLLCSLAVLLPKIIAEVRAACKGKFKKKSLPAKRGQITMRSIPAQIKATRRAFALALVIALLAKGIEALLPFDVIGASVIAMFIGMLINGYRKPGKTTAPGVKFTAKKILKFAIILLGASLNVTTTERRQNVARQLRSFGSPLVFCSVAMRRRPSAKLLLTRAISGHHRPARQPVLWHRYPPCLHYHHR